MTQEEKKTSVSPPQENETHTNKGKPLCVCIYTEFGGLITTKYARPSEIMKDCCSSFPNKKQDLAAKCVLSGGEQ